MSKKKTLSIPPLPDPIFVVEIDEYILVVGIPITTCVFPHYKFEDTNNLGYGQAFEAAEELSAKTKKLVVNAIDFFIYDPHVYDPVKLDAQMKNLMDVLQNERNKIIGTKA